VHDPMLCDLELESSLKQYKCLPVARERAASPSDTAVKSLRAYFSKRNRARSGKGHRAKPRAMSDQFSHADQGHFEHATTHKNVACVGGPGNLLKVLLVAGDGWNEALGGADADSLLSTSSGVQASSSLSFAECRTMNSDTVATLVQGAPSVPGTGRPNSSIRGQYRTRIDDET